MPEKIMEEHSIVYREFGVVPSASHPIPYPDRNHAPKRITSTTPYSQGFRFLYGHKVGPETALECVRRAIWGMLYADDACIVSRSTRGLGRMMAVLVEVFGAFGLTISESKTETMCMPIPRAPATKILVVFNATGQQYRQTTSFTYLGGTVDVAQGVLVLVQSSRL